MLRIVKTENGVVQGLPAADPRITSFKGIPFAAPPIGENRFRAPIPAKDWEGVRKAFEFAPISLQPTPGLNKEDIYTREWAVDPEIPMDEDCLYLNIWTPALTTDEKLPVYVWYFGGGLQVGNTAEMEFDGERIARRGIVVVTVNYRLNVFGFLCHPEITAESPETPGNFGHLDQQAGTRWVKRNIASFGGDPDNITIGGQSAGGASVMSQLTSPQNEGLFQKAIVESGMITGLYPGNFEFGAKKALGEEEQEGIKFFEFLGVSSLKEARALEAEYINKKAQEYNRFWGTVVDNKFCIGSPFELVARDKAMKIPIMFGHTSSEFYCEPKAGTVQEFHKMAVDLFGEEAEEFLTLCNASSGNIEEMISRASVRIVEYANRIAAGANEASPKKVPMYYYIFDAEIPGYDNPGTFHSVDLWFFFETLAKCIRPFVGKHYDLARQMCNYWANFIRSGDPNGKDADGEDMPLWEPYKKEAPFGMVFGEKSEFVKAWPGEVIQFLVKKYLSSL